MGEWREVRLGDICTLNYGKSLTSNNRKAGNIPVYSSAGITGWHNQSLVKSKGIIVGRKGTVGTVYFCDSPFYCIDTAYYVLPQDNIYDFKYLFYRLDSLGLKNLNEDSAVPGLNRETAYSQTFILPPLPEQKAIADTLSCLDDKIEMNNKINANLEQTAQAIFKSWFVDFEPFQDGEFVESELGRIPKGWRVGTFEEIIDFKNGKKRPDTTGIYPVYGGNGILGFSDEYNNENIVAIGRVGAYCGSIFLVRDKCWISDNAISAKSKQNSVAFSFYMLKAQQLNEKRIGTSQPLLTQGILNNLTCLIPTFYAIDNFEKLAQPLLKLTDENRNENLLLTDIRNFLLPKLMTGEIDVK